MATKVVFLDDLDGSPDANTVTFAYQGQEFEIDLSAKNKAKMDREMDTWITSARKRGGRSTPASSKSRAGSGMSPEQLTAVREWAKRNGYNPSKFGRVSAEIITAFEAAQAPSTPTGRTPKQNGVVEFSSTT